MASESCTATETVHDTAVLAHSVDYATLEWLQYIPIPYCGVGQFIWPYEQLLCNIQLSFSCFIYGYCGNKGLVFT